MKIFPYRYRRTRIALAKASYSRNQSEVKSSEENKPLNGIDEKLTSVSETKR